MPRLKPSTRQKDSNMLDLLIIGHSVHDTIYDGGEVFKQLGGIHNVKRSFDLVSNGKLTSRAEPAAVGEATVFIDRENSAKEVHAKLNQIVRTPKLEKAKWYHVSYLNAYRECHYVYDGFITSMDWCGKTEGYIPPKLKYFFISEDDFDVAKLSTKHPSIKFVSHSPKCAGTWANGIREFTCVSNEVKGLNVLGSGDHFAACWIFAKLSGKTDREALNFSVPNTQKWLLSR